MIFYRRLPLEGLKNARDLGGYPTLDGGVTRCLVFVRSELPRMLSKRDIGFLRRAGFKTVIDLRGAEEIKKLPDALAGEDWICYQNLPLYDEDAAGGGKSGKTPQIGSGFSWGEHYISMVRNHMPWVRDVFTALEAAGGPALFHCMTGKDRTGIIAALLLGLAGVSDEDITADYTVSQIYLREMYLKMDKGRTPGGETDLSDPFFSTAPENMERLLDYFKKAHGGIRGYLSACGLSDETLDAVRKRLVKSF